LHAREGKEPGWQLAIPPVRQKDGRAEPHGRHIEIDCRRGAWAGGGPERPERLLGTDQGEAVSIGREWRKSSWGIDGPVVEGVLGGVIRESTSRSIDLAFEQN
jgi:hypothetical protein